jgi:hypothetical protein
VEQADLRYVGASDEHGKIAFEPLRRHLVWAKGFV